MAEFIIPPESEEDRKRTTLIDLSDEHPELRASSVGVAAWGPGNGQQWGVPAGCYSFSLGPVWLAAAALVLYKYTV